MEKITLQSLLSKEIRGKVICFPTDTVYGVGAMVDDLESINRIFKMKERDSSKPLAILTPNSNIYEFVEEVNPEAKRLMDEGWPGALTLIFKKSENINDLITKGFPTIAFRMPNSKIALSILNKFGLMATTSVNISGSSPLNSVEEIEKAFYNEIDYIVTETESLSKNPSRIIDVTTCPSKIIR